MARHIETKEGLETLFKRLDALENFDDLPDYHYWYSVVRGCIDEGLAMDETDWELAPDWFRPLWRGLK